jgi:4-hydroxy-2-oxoheptanedioate aldolase
MTTPSAQTPSAQKPFVHFNPVVEKAKQGKHIFGVFTADLSPQNARLLARDPNIDYVYIDFEHNPMNFDALERFLAAIQDKAGILQRGNAQAHPAVFARFAPYASEETLWVVKQGLDIGLMGILINNLETVQQAETIVRHMRYTQRRNSKIPTPIGRRGDGPSSAPWYWGTEGGGKAEYFDRADLWPLNPQGDLLFWPMIETELGVQNADAIAQVPGVGGLYLASGGDMSMSLGVDSPTHEDVTAAFAKVMKVCQARKIVCGGTVTPENAAARIKMGYQIVSLGSYGGFSERNAATRDAAIKAGVRR